MNTELPPFKNGEHNSENALTIDCVVTPLIQYPYLHQLMYPLICCPSGLVIDSPAMYIPI